METMAQKPKDKDWNEMALKNAKHSADLHIEVGNAVKIAEAFKDVDVLSALEHLFMMAEKYRKQNQTKKVSVILEAAALINRDTGEETDLVLRLARYGHTEDSTLSIRRHTPREIFESPITYTEIVKE